MVSGPVIGRRALIASAGAAFLAPAAFAHRSKSVLSTVYWNSDNSALEVVHRLHSNDVEIGLMEARGEDAPLDMLELSNQAKLLLYIENGFRVSDDAGEIELESVGVAVADSKIVAYQEAKRNGPSNSLTVANTLLRDVFDGQTNLVNVRMARRTRTLIFSGRVGAQVASGLL